MSGTAQVVIVAIAAVVVFLIALAVVQALRARARLREFLTHNAFMPCREEAQELAQAVTGLTRSKDLTCWVKKPYKTLWNNHPIYYFTLAQKWTHSHTNEAQAFLIPFQSGVEQTVALYLRPSSIPVSPLVNLLITMVLDSADALQLEGLHKLEVSPETADLGVLAAYSEQPGALEDLLDPATRDRLVQAGDMGFFAIHCTGGRALLCELHGSRLTSISHHDRWQYIKTLVEH